MVITRQQLEQPSEVVESDSIEVSSEEQFATILASLAANLSIAALVLRFKDLPDDKRDQAVNIVIDTATVLNEMASVVKE